MKSFGELEKYQRNFNIDRPTNQNVQCMGIFSQKLGRNWLTKKKQIILFVKLE